ncbi:MAG: type II secretion system F family protein [Halanaeroarchaeum sp.]
MILDIVPIVFAGLLALGTFAPVYWDGLDRLITRVSLPLFGPFAEARADRNRRHRQALAGAHVPTTYRVYAAKSVLYSIAWGIVGTILGSYVIELTVPLLRGTDVPGEVAVGIPDLVSGLASVPGMEAIGSLFLSALTFGVLTGLGTYQLRWLLPRYEASERERRIDATLKRNVAFLFALSRSGMPFPKVLRILAANRAVYGETAEETAVAVKDIEVFGTDVLSAIQRLRDRTPSDQLEEFAENLSSVLQSGQSLSGFLREEYEYFKSEEESQQRAFLELLATMAEAYVTVFVAGPLFLITILVVIGLMLGGTLEFLRAMVYLIVPLATIGFIVYLDTITEDVRTATLGAETGTDQRRFTDVRVAPDETVDRIAMDEASFRANRYRLSIYRRIEPILTRLRAPGRQLLEHPENVLWVTVPVALLWVGLRVLGPLTAGRIDLALYDDAIIQSTLFVVGTFALAFEVADRRVKRIEAAIPDFLDRFASTNEAGMSIVESFGRVVRSDLGALSKELERTWADIRWGARIEHALLRFRGRVRTAAVTRVTTLTTNAMHSTNEIGQVLRIAADEAQASKRLERERRNEMLTYTVVVYLAFFVFLVIVGALDTIFVPAIPTGELSAGGATGLPTGGLGGGFQPVSPAEKEAYSLVFSHAAIIQSVLSGFVAGQMGSGSVKAGAKHATVMLSIAYVTFLVIV